MPLTIEHTLTQSTIDRLHNLKLQESENNVFSLQTVFSLCRSITQFPYKIGCETYYLIQDIVDTVNAIAKSIFSNAQQNVLASIQLYDAFWQAFIAQPLRIILSPMCIINNSLYEQISCYLDKNSYETTIQEPYHIVQDSSSILNEIELVNSACNKENCIWPNEGECITEYGRNYNLMFDGSGEHIQEIHQYIYSIDKVHNIECTASDRVHFLSTTCGLTKNLIDEIQLSFCKDPQSACTRIKYALSVNYLLKCGIEKEEAQIFATKAMAFSVPNIWAAILLQIERYGIAFRFFRNNLRVTPDKKVILELGFANHKPLAGDWVAQRSYNGGDPTIEGKFSMSLSELAIDRIEGMFEIHYKRNPITTVDSLIKNSVLLNSQNGMWIKPLDTSPTLIVPLYTHLNF